MIGSSGLNETESRAKKFECYYCNKLHFCGGMRRSLSENRVLIQSMMIVSSSSTSDDEQSNVQLDRVGLRKVPDFLGWNRIATWS